MKQVIDTIELLSSAHVTGEAVAQVLREAGQCEVEVTRLERDGLATDFLSIVIPVPTPTRRNWASSAAWAASARVRPSPAWCPTAMAPWSPWPPRSS